MISRAVAGSGPLLAICQNVYTVEKAGTRDTLILAGVLPENIPNPRHLC